MQTYTAPEICRVLQIPVKTLDVWVHRAIIRPTVESFGTGHHRRFSVLPDTLALACGRGLRARGLDLPTTARATAWLQTLDADDFLQAFAAGKRHLIIIGEMVVERLLSANEIRQSKMIASARKCGAVPVIVDLAALYESIVHALENEDISAGRTSPVDAVGAN